MPTLGCRFIHLFQYEQQAPCSTRIPETDLSIDSAKAYIIEIYWIWSVATKLTGLTRWLTSLWKKETKGNQNQLLKLTYGSLHGFFYLLISQILKLQTVFKAFNLWKILCLWVNLVMYLTMHPKWKKDMIFKIFVLVNYRTSYQIQLTHGIGL